MADEVPPRILVRQLGDQIVLAWTGHFLSFMIAWVSDFGTGRPPAGYHLVQTGGSSLRSMGTLADDAASVLRAILTHLEVAVMVQRGSEKFRMREEDQVVIRAWAESRLSVPRPEPSQEVN